MHSYRAIPKTERSFDWITFSIYLGLIVIGWLMLYSTKQSIPSELTDFSTTIGKQTLWIGISLLGFIVAFTLNWRNWDTLAYPIYIFGIILLLGVLVFGTEIKGSKAWFTFAGGSFQPAEFAKLSTTVALASYLSNYATNLRERQSTLIVFGIIFLPMLLILLQPDFGSVLIFTSFSIMLFRQGLSPGIFIVGLLLILVFIFSLIYNPWIVCGCLLAVSIAILLSRKLKKIKLTSWSAVVFTVYGLGLYFGKNIEIVVVLLAALILVSFWVFAPRNRQLVYAIFPILIFLNIFSFSSTLAFDHFLLPHQQERINVWLRPHLTDPQGARYNIIQSKLAIGSGGFQGKGFMNGTMTKLNYVPEQTTDFIFSTIGEEQGFVGSISVILLFVLLLLRITNIAERTKHKFISNYAYGLAGLIFFHFFINIGMAMGLMPVVGIPLTFISKGGSSLLIFSVMMGILLRMDLERFKRV